MIISLRIVFVFLLIMTRIAGMVLQAPLFSRKEIFSMGKVMFMFWLSALLIYVVPLPPEMPSTAIAVVFALISEFLIGLLIGFTCDLFVTGLEFAGNLMDTQAGLSVASLLDPSSGRTITLLSLMLKWVAFLLFLIVDGHHLVLSALVQSYQLIPIGGVANLAQGAMSVVKLAGYIFFLGVQLSAPILLVVFLVDFGFGILNRVAEQVNVFQLGFQIKPSISLFIFWVTAPGLIYSVNYMLEHISDHLLALFQGLILPISA